MDILVKEEMNELVLLPTLECKPMISCVISCAGSQIPYLSYLLVWLVFIMGFSVADTHFVMTLSEF